MVSGVRADPTRNVVDGPAASTDKIAETTNGVIKDTADGIVVLSSMSIAHAAAKERELSFKLSAAAGRHSHAFAPMQTCGWC
jgi:hypothetical protein